MRAPVDGSVRQEYPVSDMLFVQALRADAMRVNEHDAFFKS